MRIAWTTDPHLNFVNPTVLERFASDLRSAEAEAVLIGGDVGEAEDFAGYLEYLAGVLDRPVHFVLGNHDYYRGSIANVREAARATARRSPRLHWLSESDPVSLTAETALVGHGGWGDARAGNPATSDVILNDFLRIEELRQAYVGGTRSDDTPLPDTLRAALRRLGDEAGAHLRRVVPAALAGHDHVLVLMHVPPFIEACWHHGAISDDNWAPHFTCVAAGDALRDCMAVHPAKRMTVLCGHTHSAGTARILPNLDVVTGDAEYGHPKVHRVFDV